MVTITPATGASYAPPLAPPSVAPPRASSETAEQGSTPPPLAPSAPAADSTVAALVAQQVRGSGAPALSGQDLRGLDLMKVDLRGADLSGAILDGMDLSGLDLRGARLDGASLVGADLAGARLDGVSARGANLSAAQLIDTHLDGADFSQARFDGAFLGKGLQGEASAITAERVLVAKDVGFEGASFVGAHFQRMGFANVKASGADFSGAVANYLVFGQGSDLAAASFDGLGGRDVRFGGSNLTGAAFTNTQVSHADFTATTLDGARFAGSSLSGKSFNLADLRGVDFTGVAREGRYATFNVTNLDGLDFSGFDFTGAKFVGSPNSYAGSNRPPAGAAASMNGTSFAGAKLDHAMFQEIATEGADFAGAAFVRVLSMGASGLLGRDGVADGWTQGWSRAEAEEQHAIRMSVLGGVGAAPAQAAGSSAKIQAAREAAVARLDDPEAAPQDKVAQLALATLKGINEDLRKAHDAAAKVQAEGVESGPGRLLHLFA